MKKVLIIITMLLLLTGCSQKKEYDVSITLEGNPSTGYEWVVTNSDENNFKLVDTIISSDADPSTYTFYFKAKGQSIADVTFAYLRPNESIEPTYSIKYTFSVDSQKRVTLIDSTGIYDKTIPTPEIKE